MKSILKWAEWAGAMGPRYVAFRFYHEASRKSGLLKRKFPQAPTFRTWLSLAEWRQNLKPFFLDGTVIPLQDDKAELAREVTDIQAGKLQFFNGVHYSLPLESWVTNPVNGYNYDVSKHWTEIPDFHPEYGDIKFVWEKSRFLFIQAFLRFDAVSNSDSSEWIFAQIESWIQHNPINQGPNYRCSQEISIRLFNWLLALYYYKDSPALTEVRFEKILFNIYWQIRHVRAHINFSRIAVRNNHAITETLALYTFGMLFPCFEESSEWRASGKKWFEQEIIYQIYPDGTFLQFSTNYHRVVIQLMTWAIAVSSCHGDKFSERFYERAYASVKFLSTAQDKISGRLPNYGANDGSLFFRWSTSGFRDFRPALDALHFALTGNDLYASTFDDRVWFGLHKISSNAFSRLKIQDGSYSFNDGGVYILRKGDLLVWINCVRYKDRPSQADNLHIDIWKKGKNLLRDAGSFGYNAKPEMVKYFFGTGSHNTVMVEDEDQMLKGSRFIWFFWSKALKAGWTVDKESAVIQFNGSIQAFRHLGDVRHHRRIRISDEGINVLDSISGHAGRTIRQLWHLNPDTENALSLKSYRPDVTSGKTTALYSETYGQSSQAIQLVFITRSATIETDINFL